VPDGLQLRRTPGWRLPAGARSVARPTRWGNIWTVGDVVELRVSGTQRGEAVGLYNPRDERAYDLGSEATLTAEQAVRFYRQDLEWTLPDPDPFFDDLRAAFAALRGLDLACWCPLGAPCHRDVLLDLANR
jgi:hypothetical protein